MSILPEDYKVPKPPSKYMKLENEENKFRILSTPIVGWINWLNTPEGGRKPHRIHMDESFDAEEYNDEDPPKHFWAMVVWNYDPELKDKIQILEITQKTIIKPLTALDRSKDWGDLRSYDILVSRIGKGKETEYTTNPVPPKPLTPEIEKAYKASSIKLEALFTGDDPFALSDKEKAKAIDDALEGIDI
jgi:hypothetical protein